MSTSPALALIGCGAISELSYLPALAANRQWRDATWLVEPNAQRGDALAKRFGFSPERVVPRHENLPDGIALAINATPSHLHRPITLALVERGINVLVEKPFAETAADARAMIEAAATAGCLLSVNQSRRAGPTNGLIRELVRSGKLGQITRVEWSEGRPFDWPTQSGFNFRRPWQGRPRGVLLDIGVYVIDLLCWWFDAAPVMVSASLDDQGGPEASAAVQLMVGTAVVDMRLSYLVKLRNELLIEGTEGAIRASTADYDRIEMRSGSSPWKAVTARGSIDGMVQTTRLVANMLGAIAKREPLLIEAASTLPTLDVIDDIYARGHALLSDCYVDHLAQARSLGEQARAEATP